MFNTKKGSPLKFVIFILITLVVGLNSNAQGHDRGTIDYSTWNTLLQKHVNKEGEVDYSGVIKDQESLTTFLKQLSKHPPKKDWSENEKKAYLINSYNAFTIQLIIKNYPLKSIKDIGNEPFDAFKKKFISFGEKKISLDDIEKGMLVPMGDPRIHFVVNCASYSCPRLYNKSYLPHKLDEQLEKAASRFINSDLNVIDKNVIKLSKLFDWYKSDFENESQTLIDFINQYSQTKIDPKTQLKFMEYDWSLNIK